MADTTGRFCWYELMTTDLAAARNFYDPVVGWQSSDAQMPGMKYWMFKQGDAMVAGLMDLPEESRKMGTPPNWIGYVFVPDVDASAAKVTASGGKIYVPPTDIPNVGRFAIFADPHGAVLALFKGAEAMDAAQFPDQQAPGRIGWHELYAGDLDADFAFYANLFGWQKKEAMDMGPMGTYQIFGTADTALGGMMTKPPQVPVAHWAYYFNVGNIDEAIERVKSRGGQVLMGPQEVPGGGFVMQGIDPQGAHFALFGSR
jgi:predicted enzyme related to lactoylglutathione lyase